MTEARAREGYCLRPALLSCFLGTPRCFGLRAKCATTKAHLMCIMCQPATVCRVTSSDRGVPALAHLLIATLHLSRSTFLACPLAHQRRCRAQTLNNSVVWFLSYSHLRTTADNPHCNLVRDRGATALYTAQVHISTPPLPVFTLTHFPMSLHHQQTSKASSTPPQLPSFLHLHLCITASQPCPTSILCLSTASSVAPTSTYRLATGLPSR